MPSTAFCSNGDTAGTRLMSVGEKEGKGRKGKFGSLTTQPLGEPSVR